MIRQIVMIDKQKCDGCGLCADACHEGAIAMIKGKAKLIREDHCDGLGSCLPECPRGAISLTTKDALPFDPAAADMIPMINPAAIRKDALIGSNAQWPIQLRLVPLKAPFFNGADLLIAADCTAFVSKDFHNRFAEGKVILIGCPKLDREDYGQRISEILNRNDVNSVTLLRMDIPCCSDMARMVKEALMLCKKDHDLSIHILSTDGSVVQ